MHHIRFCVILILFTENKNPFLQFSLIQPFQRPRKIAYTMSTQTCRSREMHFSHTHTHKHSIHWLASNERYESRMSLHIVMNNKTVCSVNVYVRIVLHFDLHVAQCALTIITDLDCLFCDATSRAKLRLAADVRCEKFTNYTANSICN